MSAGQLKHLYGSQVHILDDHYLSTLLARLCAPETTQPLINRFVADLYTALLHSVVHHEFPSEIRTVPTRMTAAHPEAPLRAHLVNRQQKTVVVNLARAGIFPSHICYDALNYVLDPAVVRQDHIFASRMTNVKEQVTGAEMLSSKIGGDVDDAMVLIPDPMGATGSTITQVVDHYKNHVQGQAFKFVSLHLIVTPEYIKHVQSQHPEVVVYALRLDRGLSPSDVINSVPGTHWDREKGLNDKQYIIPGGGGLGEVMNNSFV